MPEDLEIAIRMVLSIVAFAVIGWSFFSKRRGKKSKAASFSLIVLAIVSVGMFFNFGYLHGRGFIHHWELFHYVLCSKYFPELGYDGLYLASIKAQEETNPLLLKQRYTRDLRTNEKVHVKSVRKHQDEIRARFSPDRWKEFSQDNRFFIQSNTFDHFGMIRSDHGCNASPTWMFIARLFDARLPVTLRNLELLATLDMLLLVVMFVVVFRTYGAEIGMVSLIIFCLNYAGRFSWFGGALLRQDWLVASVIGVCMLRSQRHVAAGALFAYATMVRLFPVFFLLGPLVLAVKSLVRDRQVPNWAWRLGLAYFLGLLIFFAAGGLAGRGVSAWPEYAGKIAQHHSTWLTNNVGMQNVLLYGPDTIFRRTVDWKLPEPWIHWQAKMNAMKSDRRVFIALAMLLFTGVIVAAAWRCSIDEATALGIGVAYAALLLTCYYWTMVMMLPFKRRSDAAVLAFFAFNVLSCFAYFVHSASEFRYGLVSWMLGALLLIWALPDALRTLRGVPEEDQALLKLA